LLEVIRDESNKRPASEVNRMRRSKLEYTIPNCTPNQLIKLLEALKDGAANPRLVSALVGDKDAHHQVKMVLRFGLVVETKDQYCLTDLGKQIVSLYRSDEFPRIFREKCIPNVPLLRDMQRVVKSRKSMTKEEFQKAIKDLVKPDPDWSPVTTVQYTNLIIGYLRLGGAVELDRKQKIVKYVL
jgi:hypothetical protein